MFRVTKIRSPVSWKPYVGEQVARAATAKTINRIVGRKIIRESSRNGLGVAVFTFPKRSSLIK